MSKRNPNQAKKEAEVALLATPASRYLFNFVRLFYRRIALLGVGVAVGATAGASAGLDGLPVVLLVDPNGAGGGGEQVSDDIDRNRI